MLGVLVDTCSSTMKFIRDTATTCVSGDKTSTARKYAHNAPLSEKVDSVTNSVLRDTVVTGVSYGALILYPTVTKNLLCSTTQFVVPMLSHLSAVHSYFTFSSVYYCSEALPYAAQALKYAQLAKVGFLFARTAFNTHESTGEIITDVVHTASHCFQLYQAEQLLK